MNIVNFNISKRAVYNEVAKTTSYTGAKFTGDDDAYLRIFTTDEDRLMLERFFNEASASITDLVKPFIVSVSTNSDPAELNIDNNYDVTLELSSRYDTTLNGSVHDAIFSFFVNLIIAKWYRFTNKGEEKIYADAAAHFINDINSKIYYRRKPTRTLPQ